MSARMDQTPGGVPIAETARVALSLPADDPTRELGGLGSAIALTMTIFVEALGYGVVAPTLPFLARQAGAGEGRIGLLVGIYAAVGLIVVIPLGILANRYGRRILVQLGLACLTVASIGFVFAPDYPSLMAARFAQGLGAASIWVGGLTMAADLSPDNSMGRSMAWISGAWSLGFVLGPALGGIGSMRTPFIVYAVLSGAALVASLLFLPETGRPHTRTTLEGILRVLRRPAVLASGVATFALAFYYGIVEGFMPLLADGMHVDRVGIGFLFALAGLPSIFLPRVSGMLADRFGDARLVVIGLIYTAAVSAAILPLARGAPLWVVFVLLGLAEILVYVPAVALLNRGMSRDDRIFATGSHNYAFSAGFFLGPTLGGWYFPIGGYPGLFTMLTVVVIAGVIGVVVLRVRIPR